MDVAQVDVRAVVRPIRTRQFRSLVIAAAEIDRRTNDGRWTDGQQNQSMVGQQDNQYSVLSNNFKDYLAQNFSAESKQTNDRYRYARWLKKS